MTRRPMFALTAVACVMVLAACGQTSTSTQVTSDSSASADSTASTSAVSPSAVAVPAAFFDRDADGEALANAWFELLSMTGNGSEGSAPTSEDVEAGRALVAPYLDSTFQLQRASGERYVIGDYVPVDIDDFEISDVVVTEPSEDVRVIRYKISTPGAEAPDAGVVYDDTNAPRMTVLRWDEALGHWVIVSHANYNSPVAAICEHPAIEVAPADPGTSADDVELGESLVAQWRDITTGAAQDPELMHPASQIQLADGQGWPNADGEPIKWTPAKAYDYDHVVVTRDGDLLVVSYDAVASDLEMEGETYVSTSSPRLLTYMLTPEGKWSLIGLANFTVPQQIPDGVDCIDGGSLASASASG